MLVKLGNNFTCVLRSEEGRLYSQTMDYVGIYLVGIFFLKGQFGHVKYKWKYDDGEFESWQAVATLQFKSSKTWDILPYFNPEPVCGIITVLPSRPCFVLLLILSFSNSLILCCSSCSLRRSFVEILSYYCHWATDTTSRIRIFWKPFFFQRDSTFPPRNKWVR